MKILLVVPRQQDIQKPDYTYTLPLGLAYVISTIEEKGFDIDCLNLNHCEGTSRENIERELNKNKYDFVATGGTLIHFKSLKEIITISKEHTSRPKTILGGSLISSEPEVVFSITNPDYGVIGEGEETIIELLNSFEKNKNKEKIQGLIFKEKGRVIHTDKRIPKNDINKIPFPNFEKIGYKEYLKHCQGNLGISNGAFDYPRPYALLGSRGCPFNCTFCYHYGQYRKRDVKNLLKEVEEVIKKYDINQIEIYDDCFSIDRQRLIEFCEGMKKIKTKIKKELIWSPQLLVSHVDDEILKILQDSGVYAISYGFESFSQKVLKSMRKPITPLMIEEAFFKTLNAGIAVQANFIFGDIAETKETANETLNWWKKNSKGQIYLGLIKPYPNSKIYQKCLEKGIIRNKKEFIEKELFNLDFNFTEEMNEEDFKWLKKEIYYKVYKYCKIVSPKKIEKENRKRYSLKIKCPYCGKKIIYKNIKIGKKFNFVVVLTCRNCKHHFYAASPIRKFLQRYSYELNAIKNLINKNPKIRKLFLKLSN